MAKGGFREGSGRNKIEIKLDLNKTINLRNDENIEELMKLLRKIRDEFYEKKDSEKK